MTPNEFIAKWRDAGDERAAAQPHFIDLCRLLGQPDPQTADPERAWFCFERGASRTGGGAGWADVWRRGCFGWEYKSRGRNLEEAHKQLLTYSGALENPPLLIVCDFARYSIRTNWTNTVQERHDFRHEDLADATVRDKLLWAFTDPDRLKPAKTRAQLTEEAAGRFAGLAARLRGRGHHPQAVAHFVNRLVFCMFAEDIGLLPNKLFQRAMERSETQPDSAEGYLRGLFAAMRAGGEFGLDDIPWFNGGLFDDDSAFPLTREDVADVLASARLYWGDIDPAILGTLFERGLDPDKRSQLGAHYTDREKIMLIVEPVVIRPLLAEWEATKAQIAAALGKAERAGKGAAAKARAEAERLHRAFLDRLAQFRVLDPACGSGNFLYLALLALKDIEHRANLEAEALGLPRGFPRVGPECVLGIELNPFAAELARVSVWIGDIQWMRRNGFEAARNPILRPLDTIECRDAVLNPDGTRAAWPKADVVVGNPPFLGNKKMIGELGEAYATALRCAWPETPGGADLVCYWFASAWAAMQAGRLTRAGLVATQSIRGTANRAVLKPIGESGRIFEAWSDEAWTVEGAAVRVSLVCFDGEKGGAARLDGAEVGEIYSDLSAERGGTDLTTSARMSANRSVAFQGPVKVGAFDVEGTIARQWLVLAQNPNGRLNQDVLSPLLNGQDITRRPSDRWIVDFGNMPEAAASFFEAPFEYVFRVVKPFRDQNRRERRRVFWWQHGETVPGLKAATQHLSKAIFTPRVAKHRLFVWAPASVVPDSRVVLIARDDDTTFGVLHSRFHELWSLALGGWHGDGDEGGRPQYTPSTGFETFPFPQGLTPDIPAAAYAADPRAQRIAAAAARLNELRETWLNPPDLVRRVPEVVPGYPDRLLPVDDAAAAVLKKRTLTNLYNARPAWLDHAHRALDEAVAEAYGWGDDWRAGTLTDDEILARLFRLNQQRAAAQGADAGST